MALFVPPTSFEFERAPSFSRPPSPARPCISDTPLGTGFATLKKAKFRPRLFKKRRKEHIVSPSVSSLVCERGPSEDIVQRDGKCNIRLDSGNVRVDSVNERGSDENDVVETPEEFIEWLCGKRDAKCEVRPQTPKERKTCFRCDIFPASGKDFTEAEEECKQLVVEAGGSIITEVEYLGGFMYTLPKGFRGPPPLKTSDETLLGGYIRITPVTTLESIEPETDENDVLDIFSAVELGNCDNHSTSATPVADSISPLAAALTTMAIGPESCEISPLPLPTRPSAISTVSNDSKQWPRPKDNDVAKRAGDWVKEKAAKRQAKIKEEIRAGIDKEVASESDYEGGVQAGALYMDGFNDLAVWMCAGSPSRDASESTLC